MYSQYINMLPAKCPNMTNETDCSVYGYYTSEEEDEDEEDGEKS